MCSVCSFDPQSKRSIYQINLGRLYRSDEPQFAAFLLPCNVEETPNSLSQDSLGAQDFICFDFQQICE